MNTAKPCENYVMKLLGSTEMIDHLKKESLCLFKHYKATFEQGNG